MKQPIYSTKPVNRFLLYTLYFLLTPIILAVIVEVIYTRDVVNIVVISLALTGFVLYRRLCYTAVFVVDESLMLKNRYKCTTIKLNEITRVYQQASLRGLWIITESGRYLLASTTTTEGIDTLINHIKSQNAKVTININ